MEYLSIFYIIIETLLTVFGIYWGIIIVAGFLQNIRNNVNIVDYIPVPFSVIIPAKNEEKTLGRLLERLTRVNYPKDKLEIIVVEDSSTDSTPNIAQWYSKEFSNVKYYHLEKNKGGKAEALNYGVNVSHGNLIAFFDADALPELDYFKKAVKGYYEGKEVQNGFYRFINTRESWLPTISSLEAEVAKYIAQGSERLAFPVPIFGYNLIISRSALNQVGLFKKSLTEDIDLWVRLVKAKIKPHYFNGEVLIESPSTVKDFVNQRVRWYRGFLDTIMLYKFNFSNRHELHVWLYLTMPLFAAISFIMYFVAPTAIMLSRHLYGLLMLSGVSSNILGIALGAAIYLYYIYRDKNVSFKGPLSVIYTFVLLYSSFLAVTSKIFRRNINWTVTKKSGYIDIKKL
ncbi:MAG: glycosyltransferase [Conexivisphaerales archaeon]